MISVFTYSYSCGLAYSTSVTPTVLVILRGCHRCGNGEAGQGLSFGAEHEKLTEQTEFKEIRKEWKQRKKEEEAQRKAEEERQRAANSAAAVAAAAAIQAPPDPTAGDGTQPPTTYGGSRSLQLPPIGYQTSAYPAPPSGTVPQQPLPDYSNSQMYQNYPPPHSPYGQPPQSMYSQCKQQTTRRAQDVPCRN